MKEAKEVKGAPELFSLFCPGFIYFFGFGSSLLNLINISFRIFVLTREMVLQFSFLWES